MQYERGTAADCRDYLVPIPLAQPGRNDDEVEPLSTQQTFELRYCRRLGIVPRLIQDGTASLKEGWVVSNAEQSCRSREHLKIPSSGAMGKVSTIYPRNHQDVSTDPKPWAVRLNVRYRTEEM
jgi:hypothetical protein